MFQTSGDTTSLGPRLEVRADKTAGGPAIAIFDATRARSKLSATGGALTSTTLLEDGEFGLVALGANSAIFAFRSGQTIYGVSSNTTRAV